MPGSTQIKKIDIQDPADQKQLAKLQQKTSSRQQLYLVDQTAVPTAPRAGSYTSNILAGRGAARATWKHLHNLCQKQQVSACHFDYDQDQILVRGRIADQLINIGNLTPTDYLDLIGYLQILAGLNLNQTVNQQGRLGLTGASQAWFNLSPTVNGPRLTLSLDWHIKRPKNQLGQWYFWGHDRQHLSQALGKASGLILINCINPAGRRLGLDCIIDVLSPKLNYLSLTTIMERPLATKAPISQLEINGRRGLNQIDGLKQAQNSDSDILIIDQIQASRVWRQLLDLSKNRLVIGTTGYPDSSLIPEKLMLSGVTSHQLRTINLTIVGLRLIRACQSPGRGRGRPPAKKSIPQTKSASVDQFKWLWSQFNISQPEQQQALINLAGQAASEMAVKPAAWLGPRTRLDYHGWLFLTEVLAFGQQLKPYLEAAGFSADLKQKARQLGLLGWSFDGLIKVMLRQTSADELKRQLKQ